MTDAICITAIFVGAPIAMGVAGWLIGLGRAAEINAEARLLEAQTASHSCQGENTDG